MGLRHRRGTAASATAANPVLEASEIGYETDTHKWKIGDGSTAWNSLPYQPSTSALTNPMTTLGDLIYEDSTPAAARLAGNTTTTKKFLRQTGNGTISAAPAWDTLASGDIPNNAANTSGTAANLSGTPALPNGTTATTQSAGDASTKLATTAYHDNNQSVIRVRAVAASSLTSIATGLENGDTIDGITLATGDKVLVTGQGTPANNGVYVVQASGAAPRSSDTINAGTLFSVTEGTQYGDSTWRVTTDGAITLGTTALTIAQFLPNLPSTWPLITTGSWMFVETGNASTQATTLNRLYMMPFVVPRPITLTSFSVEVTTGGTTGSVLRGGLFNGSALTMLPSTLVTDYGTVATTGTGVMTWTSGAALTAGALYFLAVASQVATCTVRVRQTANVLVVQPTSQGTPSVNVLATSHFASSISGALSSNPTVAGQTQGPAVLVQFT